MTELARFTRKVVSIAQKAVAGLPAPAVNKGETGYADRVIVSIHALREYLEQPYRRLMDILYEMPPYRQDRVEILLETLNSDIEELQRTNIEELEVKINSAVYNLFDLSDEDIDVIEEHLTVF